MMYRLRFIFAKDNSDLVVCLACIYLDGKT